ncbi:TraR/DksA C4-type zinc finger protein [Ideonella sp. A 288]|uniref:TraR/DksA family transcriptional regulator n=1 Tax=Ideonella sp. A 288 TaxID=1962181 RepID=UPI000B4AE575|nr:TraR/DksA C4-type zinc finger protein [Ideonella sp. A 288]
MSKHLTPAERSQLEARLRERLQSLRARMSTQLDGLSRAEHAREVLLQDGDDGPQRDADREVDFAMTDREGAEFAATEQALARLAAGTYGECADCGADVPYARLALEPQALRCVACESVRERTAPRTASL